MYEFHGIKWMSDNELDADSPERRGPGWAHAYVPVLGPENSPTGTAHVPIFMPRVYKELKRFALAVYKAAGGTTDVEMSGWWSGIKKAFKKMAKVVAHNKVLRQVAAKGLEAAVPGGATVSDKAKGILEDLVSKYRGGSTEAANQIKGLLEKANKGGTQDVKVLDEVRREYVRQQSAGLPALMTTMASGEVVVYDPIYGAKRKMTRKQYKKQAAKRKKQAAKRKQQEGKPQRTSPLRNSADTLRQGTAPGARLQQQMQAQPYSMQQPGMMQQPGYPQDYGYPQPGYPQDYGYPQPGYPQDYGYPQGGPSNSGPQESYYDPEQEAQDDADLQAAAEENMARASTVDDIDSEMEGDAYFDIGKKKRKHDFNEDERAAYNRLSSSEKQQVDKMSDGDARRYLRSRSAEQRSTDKERSRERERTQREQKYRAEQQKKERERQGAQIRRDREQQGRRTQGRLEAERKRMVETVQRRAQAEQRIQTRRAESQEYEEQIANLEETLERRDLSDEKRLALEAQKANYQDRLQQADKDLVQADLEAQRLEYAHRESMAKIRQGEPTAPAPVIYDDERGEEYDTDDPLVREALAQMQQNQDVEDENNGEE